MNWPNLDTGDGGFKYIMIMQIMQAAIINLFIELVWNQTI